MGEGEGGMFQDSGIETCILSRVEWITSPGSMHETRDRTWCNGETQGYWVKNEVRGGIGMGNTCIFKTASCQYITKITTIL